MKICHISQEYPPETHVGGIGTYTYNVAGALARLGHEVHVISATSGPERTGMDNGVCVHRIRSRNARPVECSQLIHSFAVAKKIRELQRNFDIVQASEFAGEALCLSFQRRMPLVTRLATPMFLLKRLNGRFFFGLRPFSNLMEKRQTVQSAGIFTSTRALADAVTREWGIDRNRVVVIPNSVDIARIMRLASARKPPDNVRDRKFMLYFGHLEERKGVPILADALPTVFDRFDEVEMVFAGSDFGYNGTPMKEYIRKKAGRHVNRIKFFGNLSHEELFPLVSAANLVILPSLWEAFGFVCVEAMALGRPVIASSGSGFAEIIEDNQSGFLVEPGNSGLLAQKIMGLLGDTEGRIRISEGARKRAQEFEVSNVVLRLLEYYEGIRDRWRQSVN